MRFPNQNNTLIFDRTVEELECFLLFCIVVAGKKASVQVKMLESFLEGSNTPFEFIRQLDRENKLLEKIQISRLGQYTRLHRCFQELVNSNLDLSTCSVEDLENIHGVGSKTSRFFVVCNRQNARHAVLDTYILRFMRDVLCINTQKTTPNGSEYARLEKKYLSLVDHLNINPAEFDLAIWKSYSQSDSKHFEEFIKNAGIDCMFIKNTQSGILKFRFVQRSFA
jgi:thermostable 8-oxoguanine DNA glycosylase